MADKEINLLLLLINLLSIVLDYYTYGYAQTTDVVKQTATHLSYTNYSIGHISQMIFTSSKQFHFILLKTHW